MDKLPVWVALPQGLVLGLLLGVAVMRSGISVGSVILAVLVLGVAFCLGMSAPRPVPVAKPDSDKPEPPAL